MTGIDERNNEAAPKGLSYQLEEVIELSQGELLDFCGRNDHKLREIEQQFGIRIVPRGTTLKLKGDADKVARARNLITELIVLTRGKTPVSTQQFRYAVDSASSDSGEDLKAVFADKVSLGFRKRAVTAMTAGQKSYLDAIRTHDIVFGVGPAGTGKTYLAMAMAVHYLQNSQVRRIVLVRPAVEAGEKLGFLPGDISQKFDPYVRPLYDALNDMMEPERAKHLIENGVVEVAPLAFMRGRTLNSSFVILDEAQNTTVEQMKMFLTRLGFDSKAVVTGDITQVDLPTGKESGLTHVHKILKGIEGIAFCQFEKRDVVRHKLVQRIVQAYESYGAGGRSVVEPELPLDLPKVQDADGQSLERDVAKAGE